MLYSALALLSVLATVCSQQTTAASPPVIEVPLTSNGNQYSLRFLASSPLDAVTREFCVTNAESLGITPLTEQSLPLCQQPVAAHIQSYVQEMLAREPAAQEVIAVSEEEAVRHMKKCCYYLCLFACSSLLLPFFMAGDDNICLYMSIASS